MKIEFEIKLLVGMISYENIETGYWSISNEKNKYRIKDIPEDLKNNNLKIAAIIKETDTDISIFMTEKSIKILEYKILNK